MIEVKNVKKKFGENVVLDGIDLTINKGDVIAIIGPSGTGKSTLLRCIDRLEKPEEGELIIDDLKVNLAQASKKELIDIRKRTAMVFQNWNLFSKKTALENVMEGLTVVKKMDKATAKKIAEEQLQNVGLLDWSNHYPRHLSGGQQQRVAIARALAMEPDILCFDEPTSALDPELTGEVLKVLRNLADKKTTMIIVTHEMAFARDVASQVIFMDDGYILEQGRPEEVFDNPEQERTKQFLSSYS